MNKRFQSVFKRRRFGVAAILLCFSLTFFFAAPRPAFAIVDINQAINNVLTPVWDFLKKAYEKGGAAAFQKATRSALNKIAYDTATWIGSGNSGQKPLFVTKNWGDYLAQIGDEAAGSFIEGTVKNWSNADWSNDKKGTKDNEACTSAYNDCLNNATLSNCNKGCKDNACLNACVANNPRVLSATCEENLINCNTGDKSEKVTASLTTSNSGTNVCEPSSLQAKLKISLGLVNEQRPQAPNCTASEMVKNWEEAIKQENFLGEFADFMSPTTNDLGIYLTLYTGMSDSVNAEVDSSKTKLVADGGWLDLQDIAGNKIGMPGDAQLKAEQSKQGYISNMATFAGDALIDSANVFLNQLAMTAYNRWMSNLTKHATDGNVDLSKPSSDPSIQYGEAVVKESAAQLVEPNFSVRADYDILSSLTLCRDRSNPGPTECVIDDKLMEAFTEKKTVAEAIKEGYLHKEWLFTVDFREGVYNLRNIEIMRKYRLVPIGWEVAAAADKKAALIDLVSCFSSTDSYNEYTSNFDIHNQTWCQGLVDPNWVLKAPLNYCAKQGYGSQILDISVVPEADSEGSTEDTVLITRGENYCADEKTCIKEKNDGSCEAYGYCKSERRTWNFDSKSCEPISNSCNSFINSTSGQKVAYLENTLDYGNCNADSAGCKLYSIFGAYASSTGQVAWSNTAASSAHFNNKLSGCSANDEGCNEYLRVKPSWGSNLIMGAGFDYDNIGDSLIEGRINGYWPIWSPGNKSAEIIDAGTIDNSSSGKAILLESVGNAATSSVSLSSNNAVSMLPAGLNVYPDETYTLSADVYLIEGNSISAMIGGDYQTVSRTTDKGVWRHLSVTRSLKDKPLSELAFSITGASATNNVRLAVRNLKLEMNSWDSGFSLYSSYKAYTKIIPPYLAAACYVSADSGNPDYRLRADAPSACKNYVRRCNRDEAGCERYSEKATGFTVAAQAVSSDYCDSSCNGYDLYVARSSYFFSPAAEKIIPANSTKCGAQAVGCAEFTNLDAAAAGGETREYYTQLKQCIKPGSSCADFYTWVGSDESGYQLKSLVLKKDQLGQPAVTEDDSDECNQQIFNLPADDPAYNADCRQYYSKSGNISYHLSASTISCSDNCHTYRLTEKNIDITLTQAQCTGTGRFWNSASSVCYSCQNGGVWDSKQQACLYQAIPNEGQKCSAAVNGCREYNGSLGYNTKLVGSYSFESDLGGWEGRCGDDAALSQASNSNNGKSLLYDKGANAGGVMHQTECEETINTSWLDRIFGSANAALTSYIRREFGKTLVQGQAYSFKFTAAASASTNVSIAFINEQGEMSYFNATDDNPTGQFAVTGDSDWHAYEVNLDELNHAVDNAESLIIVADKDFYLDNAVLTGITNRYYLIKGSSKIPDVCYYDMLDNFQGEDYNLGCSLYTDRAGNNHYLHQFSRLCQDSAVGCELMVDTANYDDYQAGIWKDENNNGNCDAGEGDCVSVPGDRFVYAIYDGSKLCNSADLGCARLGEAVSSGSTIDWSDVFKLNNPNNYSQILCSGDDAGCEAWKTVADGSLSYFKNPGNNACVYRLSTDPARPGKAWYKVPVMRCDLNNNGSIDTASEKSGAVCSTVSDCIDNRPCLVDNNDYDCSVSYLKTFGFGGGGQQIPVPSQAAGLCDTNAAGCSEFIDPVSDYSPNLILNPSLNTFNGWSGNKGAYEQTVTIEPNKLYIFSINIINANLTGNDVSLTFPAGVSLLREDNNLSTTTSLALNIPLTNASQRYIFHSRGNSRVKVTRGNESYEVVLREAVVNYQFKQDLDKSSCNGIVNINNGCVLFNERVVDGASGLKTLIGGWNAAGSKDGQAPVVCAAGNCSANSLIKVRPDRVCASWLDCLTYTEDPETKERTCFALGECNRLGENNECTNFIKESGSLLTAGSANLSKITGYSVLDQYNLGSMKEVGLNTEAHYNFEEGSPVLVCKNVDGGDCAFNKSIFEDSIIDSPSKATIDYPAEGKVYLKVMSGQMISPHSAEAPISVQPGQDYYLNFLVNTKNAGVNAKVWVKNFKQADIFSTTVSANNGWERKVIKIPAAKIDKNTSIILYFGADSAAKEERYVYFDDINVEPVLQTGVNKFTAKECRLFPSQDAASCTSKNSQVVSDGLVGYCLQHDPANKNVCLLWYPIDEISPDSKSSRSNFGYQGAYPLNYCTEANGNFVLVEKRIAKLVNSEKFTGSSSSVKCFYNGNPILNFCRDNKGSHDDAKDEVGGNEVLSTCGSGRSADKWDYFVFQVEGWERKDTYCIPYNNPRNATRLTATTEPTSIKTSHTEFDPFVYDVSSFNGWYLYNGFSSRDDGKLDESKNADPNARIYEYDYPAAVEDQLKFVSSSETDKVFYPTCNRFVQLVDASGNNKAWASRTSKNSFYPYNTPQYFRDEQNYYGPSCYLKNQGECLDYNDCSTPHCYCNEDGGYCDGDTVFGDCNKWADKPVSCDTPGALQYTANAYNFTMYGRNRSLIPFGAATFPDDFNIFASEPIKFRNQYSNKIDQEAFAGRPYGCTGVGCANLGYCSLDPNVLCILDSTKGATSSLINKKSCGSANGTCLPLWNAEKVVTRDFISGNILKNIFLKSFGSFSFSTSTQAYVSGGNSLDSTFRIGYLENLKKSKQACASTNHLSPANDGDYNKYWCPVYPTITNVKLNNITSASLNFNVSTPGVYTLTFNTFVDPEQQPLKDLVINWGDGTVQNLVNQDHRPDAGNPHKVYHFYKGDITTAKIGITITDNWGLYKETGTNTVINPGGEIIK